MSEAPPRRRIDELVQRWTLAGLRLVLVEGPSDERFFALLKRLDHCDAALADLDVAPIDTVEIPLDLLESHNLTGTGARHRVIAFTREVLSRYAMSGLLGIVDADLDRWLDIDHRSQALLYTDHGCLDAYGWTPDTLNRLIVVFHCERRIDRAAKLQSLYSSISESCKALAAIRLVARKHPALGVVMHDSDKSLAVKGTTVALDIAGYLSQCRLTRDRRADCISLVAHAQASLREVSVCDVLNSHDLIWLLTYALRELSSFPRRQVTAELVASTFVTHTVELQDLGQRPLFKALSRWASGAA